MAHSIDIAVRKSSEIPSVFYGLPCAECRAYYASNASECPVCHSTERVMAPSAPRASEMRMTVG